MSGLSGPADINLVAYRQVIKTYMRYVLIRATRYTNSKHGAGHIAVHSFVSAYTIMKKLHIPDRIPLILDSVIEVIGNDIVKNPTHAEETEKLGLAGPLLKNAKVRKVAKALNRLEGFSVQTLILGAIEDMSIEDLTFVYPGKSVSQIESVINRAAKQFADDLSELTGVKTVDTAKWLNRLKESLDVHVMETAGKAALVYLDGVIHDGWKPKYVINIED